MKHTKTLALSSSAMLAALSASLVGVAASPALAAGQATAQGETDSIETIVVTARKRSEDMLKTPVAVSVLSGGDIRARGIVSLTDISKFTPGMSISNNSSGRTDRSFQQIIIRGMTPSTSLSVLTSTFIDGVPVASPTAIASVDDPERVEVLKGPQSAYFGRQTFAGAVNVVTRTPSDVFGGSMSALIGTRGNVDLHADVEGPIIGDKLTGRLSLREYEKKGSYPNAASVGQRVGDQSSKSASLTLVAKPVEGLTIKFLGMKWSDEDGPSAQGLIKPSQANCTLNGFTSAAGTTAMSNRYFCGTAPKLIGDPASNTVVDKQVQNYLSSSVGRIVTAGDGVKEYGLVREAEHYGLNVSYDIDSLGITVSSLSGMNREFFSELADLDNMDTRGLTYNTYSPTGVLIPGTTGLNMPVAGGRTYYDYPYLIERRNRDVSQEFRVASNGEGRFRWQGGVSYLNAEVHSSGGGAPSALISTIVGAQEAITKGAFVGLSYDVTDKITVDFDGRYQIDQITGYKANTHDVDARGKYKNFMPRVIAQYKFTPAVMAYATYAKGISPGAFNTQSRTLTPSQLAQVEAAYGSKIGIAVDPEQLDHFELGLKGRYLDGKATLSVAVYADKWKDQITSTPVNYINAAGIISNINVTGNTGDVKLKGIEVEGKLAPIDHVLINFSAAINDSEIGNYACGSCYTLNGSKDFHGKQMPNSVKNSAVLGIQYSNALSFIDQGSWYARADYSYKSGVYAEAANIAKSPDNHLVNVRAGLNVSSWNLEGYVTNLFDSHAYTSIAPSYYFHPTQGNFTNWSTLVVGLPELRTVGVRARYEF